MSQTFVDKPDKGKNKKERVHCTRCKYFWETSSLLWQATCPSCGNKARL